MPETNPALNLLERVDVAGDQFEVDWREGRKPRIEDYLVAAPAGDRDSLFATLIGIELELRFSSGEWVELDALKARFSNYHSIIDSVYDRLRPTPGDTAVPGSSLRCDSPMSSVGDVVVPGYEILGELGRGSMGVVYRARQVGLNRVVALKMILAGDHAARDSVVRFLTEAELVARLQHPNIVPVYEFGTAGGRPYFSLEYVAGGSLAERLRGEPKPAAEAARLIETLARTIHIAHTAGIVHRDLKPANILLALDGTPKIADFGLARSVNAESTATGTVLGTPCYMAPEQAEGHKGVGPAADVYSLGAILYECLTGRPPFRGATPVETMNQVRSREPVSVRALQPGVARDLETITLACLRKEPRLRYQAAEALAEDLGRWLAGRPIVARPVGPAERMSKWVRRNRAASVAIAAITLGGFVTAVAALIAFEQMRRAAVERERVAQLQVGYLDLTARAIRQGNPRDVLAVVRQAEKDGIEITPELRFEEAASLDALGRTDDARDRWNRLLAGNLAPDVRARTELRFGADVTGIDDERATALVDSAVRSGQLPPGDRAFAGATRARTTADAEDSLKVTLSHDPTHFPARRLLALILVTTGRLAEAMRTAEDMRLLSPDSPDPLWVLLFAHGLKGDGANAARVFELLKPHLHAEIEKPTESIARHLPRVRNEFLIAAGRAVRMEEPAPRVASVIEFPGLKSAGINPLISSPLPFRRLPHQFRAAADDLWFLIRTRDAFDVVDELANDDSKRTAFAAELERRPEGFKQFVYALALMDRAMDYKDARGTAPPHSDRIRALIAEAGAAHETAAGTPALLDIRAFALEGAIMAFTIAGRPGWTADPDPAMLRKVAELLRVRLQDPEPIPRTSIDFMVRAAKQADLTIARMILDDWDRRFPADPLTLRHRADVEFRSEAYRPALIAAEKALAANPSDTATRTIHDQCRVKLGLPPIPGK